VVIVNAGVTGCGTGGAGRYAAPFYLPAPFVVTID